MQCFMTGTHQKMNISQIVNFYRKFAQNMKQYGLDAKKY